MSLRPRYSLLTLLLLTAAIAGGMKLWRGPHWGELTDPPSTDARLALQEHAQLANFIHGFGVEEVRYQYLRLWEQTSWTFAEGRIFQRPLIVSAELELVLGYPWVLPLRTGWTSVVYWAAEPMVAPEPQTIYLLGEDQRIFRYESNPEPVLQVVALERIASREVRSRLLIAFTELEAKTKKSSP